MMQELLLVLLSEETPDCSQLVQFNILEIIKHLQPQMTSKQDEERVKATNIFRQLLSHSEYKLTNEENSFLFQFFLQKLNDTTSLIHTCVILQLLIQNSTDQLKLVSPFLDSIIKDQVQIPLFSREARMTIYEIYQFLATLKITNQLISAAIKSIRNEKDPRNIMICFKLIDQILQSPIVAEPYLPNLFSFLDCYYPIEFNEKADKRFALKREDIAKQLDIVLCRPPLVKMSLPIIFDKLDSQYNVAQISALTTLTVLFEQDFPLPVRQRLYIEIYEKLQQITETFLEEDVITAISITISKLFEKSMQFEYNFLTDRILNNQFNLIDQVPLTQQGIIAQGIIKQCVSVKYGLFERYCQLFLKVFQLKNLTVLQKRLEILLQLCVALKQAEKQKELFDNLETINLIQTSMLTVIEQNNDIAFVIGLKIILELFKINQQLFPNKLLHIHQQLEIILLNKLTKVNQEDQLSIQLQKCVLDYFFIAGIINMTLYMNFIEEWKQNNLELFIYSLSCSFNQGNEYFADFTKTIISDLEQNQNLSNIRQYIYRINRYLDSVQLTLQQRQYKAETITNHILQIKFSQLKDKLILKSLKQLYNTVFTLCSNNNDIIQFIDQVSLNWILKLDDTSLYLYSKAIYSIMSKPQLSNLRNQVCEYILLNQYFEDNQQENRLYTYKFIKYILQDNTLENMVPFLHDFQIGKNNCFNKDGLQKQQLQLVVLNIFINQGRQESMNILNQQLIQFNFSLASLHQILKKKKNINIEWFNNEILKIVSQHITDYKITETNLVLRILLNRCDISFVIEMDKGMDVLNLLMENYYIAHPLINQEIELNLILNLSEKLDKQNTLRRLLSLMENISDIKITILIITQIGLRSNQGRYNLNLYQEVMNTLKQLLNNKKRMIRQATQLAINEWYLIQSK